MDKVQINMNGKGKGLVEIPETSSRRASSQFQPSSSQIQPDNHRLDEHQFSHRSQPTVNLQTLDSDFARLSFAVSNHVQSVNPILQNHSNLVINGGDVDGGPRLSHQHQHHHHHQLNNIVIGSSSNSVSDSYINPGEASSTTTHHNNGFFNGYPYPSVNSSFYQSALRNGFGSGINCYPRNNESFGYNHDPSSSMNNEKLSILSRATHPVFSKHLQKMIAECPREVFYTIFKDLINHVCYLMMDACGHEVVQSLMVNCSSEQIAMIVDKVTQDRHRFVHICIKPFGTRTIQLLMMCIRIRSRDQILRIVETISREAYRLARNQNSQGVIVKCFEEFTLSNCWNLLDAITQSCLLIAKDQNGCIMLRTLLLKDYGELRQSLIPVIIDFAWELCLDSYGNYLVQFVVMEMVDVAEHLMRRLRWNYASLSRDKHGSHVVQKLLKIKGIETTSVVIELLQHINTLVLDKYGNYVIQTAWDVSKEYMRGEMWRHMQPYIPLMRCNKYGQKILDKIQKSWRA